MRKKLREDINYLSLNNNKAKYDIVLVGIKFSHELGSAIIDIFYEYQLEVN